MIEARYLDNLKCNINIDSECDVYPLSHPVDANQLMLLGFNWILQLPVIWISAGAGFTGQDKFSKFGVRVLVALMESAFFIFTIPGAILILLSFGPFIPKLGVWLIEAGVGNAAWVIYSVGTIAFGINLILDPS
mmetsp:Transcript_24898/g.33354  ORF Transcript_24898/g.33354 Transcript_24898/m.33354 type:complete len:134 (-) Transcript_24898:477-878(-)